MNRAGEEEDAEVDGGGQRVRQERLEQGAHQLRHVPRQTPGTVLLTSVTVKPGIVPLTYSYTLLSHSLYLCGPIKK